MVETGLWHTLAWSKCHTGCCVCEADEDVNLPSQIYGYQLYSRCGIGYQTCYLTLTEVNICVLGNVVLVVGRSSPPNKDSLLLLSD